MTTLGMNTKAIFYPPFCQGRVLKESSEHGITRIEISYYADSVEMEGEYFKDEFTEQAEKDLATVLKALNELEGLCYTVSQLALMETFQATMKGNQLFVRQPDVCALVFANNAKSGSYCGFFKNIPETHTFNHEAFLKANSLAGPGSIIRCVLQPQGPEGYKKECTYEKETPLAQIPGLQYQLEPVFIKQKPSTWSDEGINKTILGLFKLRELPGAIVT